MVKRTFWMVLALVVLSLSLYAQGETTGNISGIVRDPTGAIVPDAKITLTNVGTGVTRTQTSGAAGEYSFVSLDLGKYRLEVEKSGFRKFVHENIEVHVNDRLRINAAMEVGQVSETVTVSEQAIIVTTQTPALSGLVEGTQIRDMPLPNRNFMGLTMLVPGVTFTGGREISLGGLSGNPMYINGNRNTANNWLVDGSRNTDTGSNGTLFVYPSIDAIGEFRILTNSFDAEFGRNAGGIINVVTRSGSRDFHGGAYEFVRNDKFAARDAFQFTRPIPDREGFKTPYRYNNYGYNIGGPFWIPRVFNHDKNKSFFFWSHEWRKIREFRVLNTTTIPTLAERTGVFARAINNPAGGQFGNNTIPASLIDSNAKAFLDAGFWPQPNIPGIANQYRFVGSVPNDTRQELVRYDHNVSDNFRVMVRYIHDSWTQFYPTGIWGGSPLPDIFPNATGTPAHNLVMKTTHIINPRLLNEVQYDYSANAITAALASTRGLRSNVAGFKTGQLFPNNEFHNSLNLVPNVNISGIAGWGSFAPFFNENPSFTWQDNLAWTRGKHDFKFGVLYSREYKNEGSGGGDTPGTYNFDGRFTGVAFADFLLGRTSSYSEERRDVIVNLYYPAFEWYAQDSWKVTPSLTLTFGLRHSWYSNPVDKNDLLVSFLPGRFSDANRVTLNANGSLATNAQGQVIGDRFNGLIFPVGSLAGHDSPYGRLVQSNDKNNFGPRFGFAWDPFNSGKTSIRGGYGIYYDRTLIGLVLQNAFSHPLANERVSIDNALISDPRAGAPATAVFPLSVTITGDPFVTPITQHWNLSIQRQLGPGSIFQIAYAGSGGNHLLRQLQRNQPRPQVARSLGNVINRARPYQGFGSLNSRETISTSRYNSLQLLWRQDLKRAGLMLNAAYTWSKVMTDSTDDRGESPQDSFGPSRLERGPAGYDRTQVFTPSFTWSIPHRKWNAVADRVLGGWEIAGHMAFWTGTPLTVAQLGDPLLVGGNSRPNVIGTPTINSSTADRLCYLYSSTNPFCAGKPGSDAFAQLTATSPTFGNAGRRLLRGPGVNNWDMAVFKNFTFQEAKWRLQYRLEMINAFNHISLGNPASTTLGAGNFGQITGNRGPRIIQMGLKLNY